MRPKKKPKKVVINYPPVKTRKWIPPDLRPKRPKPGPKYVKPEGISQKLDHSTLAKIWHQYYFQGDVAVLTGNFNQFSKRFQLERVGRQGNKVDDE